MNHPRPETRLHKAIMLILIAAFCNTIMIVFVKLASATLPVSLILFFRYLITLVIILPFVYFNPAKQPTVTFLKTQHPWLHLVRDSFGLVGLFTYFYTAKYTSLAGATVLFNTSPLFIPLISFFWGGFKIVHRLWWGMALGFLGVILIVNPGHELMNTVSLVGVLSGFCAAMVFVGSRYLTYSEPPLRNMFYYFMVGTLVMLPITFFEPHWNLIGIKELLLLLAMGLFGYLYQFFFTHATRHAPVRLTSSFMYASVIFSIFFDWWLWNDMPTKNTLLGIGCIIAGACLLLLLYPKDDTQKRVSVVRQTD
jgi:drug/metabolite transporter (DMT)-like permease